MRALMTTLILLQLAGLARADDLYDRGRRKQRAGIALIAVGSFLIVGGAGTIFTSMVAGGDYLPQPGQPQPPNVLLQIGLGIFVPGVVMHAIGLPLDVAGTVDVDRWRDGKTASLAAVRF
jgi:hypothetical protein